MATTDDVRTRLNSLKILTQQLKNSTTSGPMNFGHIKTLIGNLKHISQTPTQSSYKQPSFDQRSFSNYESNSKRINEDQEQSNYYRPLFDEPKRKSMEKKTKLSDEQEIIRLRQQNLRLQEKLGFMRQQLSKSKQNSKQIERQPDKAQLPFFRHSQLINAFVCRFHIPQQDYQKVQYSEFGIQLKLDRLIFLRKQKGSIEQFDLTTLKEVHYLYSHVILFRFQEFIMDQYISNDIKIESKVPQLTNIFLKFDSEQHLHKWDLSIFINFQIVNSINQNKLFDSFFKRLNQQKAVLKQNKQISDIRASKELDQKKQKDLLQLLIKRRQDYLEVRSLIQEKLDHKKIQFEQNNFSPIKEEFSFQKNSNPREKSSSKGKTNPFTTYNDNFPKKKRSFQNDKYALDRPQASLSPSMIESISEADEFSKKNGSMVGQTKYFTKPRDSKGSDINQANQNIISPRFSMSGSYQKQVPHRMSNQTFSLSSQLQVDPNKSNQMFNSLGQGLNQNINGIPQPRNSPLNNPKDMQKQITLSRNKLITGIFATKYSKDGFSPHEKKVFLSLDCKKLCWCEKDKQSQYKSIPLEVITKVQYGIIGEGISKHVKKPDARYFCVIQYYSGQYKKKTIQLGSGNYQEIKRFVDDLKVIINSTRGIPIEKFNEI